MLRKQASALVLESWRVPARASADGIRKAAHRVAFDYEPRPGYLYVRARMISSRTNDNHDTFPAGEIEKGYKSFLGKPVFVNHHNSNHQRARGVIVAVALHRDRNPDGTPDTWVEGLHEVDAVRFPRLAQAIIEGKVNRTSMGVDVEWSTCSACGNKATSPAEYCRHLPAMKGKKIRKRNQATGKVEERLIHEVCAGLSFFENSLLVEDPADPTAYLLGDVDARGLAKSASARTASLSGPHPGRMQGGTCRENCDYGGTTCLGCGGPVRVNLHKTDINGGWHHEDGMKRDHPAMPADADAVMASVPGQIARKDQARMRVRETLNRQFEQLSGGPVPQRRGDEDQMPPDPFTAARRKKKARPGAKPVRGYGADARFDGVSLKKDRNGYFVHTHRARSDSYATPDDIPASDVDYIRSTGSRHEAAPRPKAEPGDHPWFREHPVSAAHVLDAWHDSTSDEKSLGRRWYSDAHHVAKAIAAGDAAIGAGLLSAYSPQTAWPVNLFNASRAMLGDPPGPGTGAMGMQQRAAMRILSGEHHSTVLKAPKTSDFAHLIEHGGDTPEDEKTGHQRVVIDRHALSVAAGRRLSKEETSGAPIDKRHHYEHVAGAYREAAHILSRATGKKISAHQVQAVTWLRQVRRNKEEDESSRGGGGKGRVIMQQNSKPRWEHHHRLHHPEGIDPHNMHYHGQRKEAYGETRVPSQVDTLRMEECPVCGEREVWSGDRCPVCGFIVPPSLFRDPDLTRAQQVREQLDQQGEVVTGQDIGSGDDADSQLLHPDQLAPDGVPAVQDDGKGPLPGEDQEDPGEEGDDPEEGEEDHDGSPGGELSCPACGQQFEPDLAAQPGVPCPACGQAALEPTGGPQKDQEAAPPGDEEDDEGEDDEDERDEMAPTGKTAAATAQARRTAALEAENAVLKAQLGFLATAAGVDRELDQIRQRVMHRHADLLNPASPVPDPPEAPATESTEQALAPGSMDDPSRPGSTPGANAHVPAAQTTTAITPGVEVQTPPATMLTDVTAPVTGTNPPQDGGVPIEQRRIETDVRIDPDPLKASGPGIGGIGDNGAAFPWLLDGQQRKNPAQGAGLATQGSRGEAESAARTFASIRLARLRVQAGLAQGDELSVAERIERDAALSGAMIEHEIGILERVAPQRGAQRPMQRAAARQAPSLASVGSAQYAPAAMAGDDLDGSDLFL